MMPVALPSSQKQAIFDLADQGVTPVEIIRRLGISRSAVYARLAERRHALDTDWPAERVEKLQRIHAAAMVVIAEAFDATVDEIASRLRAGARAAARPSEILPPPEHREGEEAPDENHPDMEGRTGGSASPRQRTSEADAPPPNSLPAESQTSSATGEVTPPPPAPVVEAAPVARLYGFKTIDGKWLTKDGKGFTTIPAEAWAGDASKAKEARPRLANARFCKIREFD